MGLSFGYRTMEDVVQARLQRRSYKVTIGGEDKMLTRYVEDHELVGNALWYVVSQRVDGNEIARFIALDLLDCIEDASSHRGPWGYKDLSESMGPYETSCPLRFLDVVPQPADASLPDWRDKVRRWHACNA